MGHVRSLTRALVAVAVLGNAGGCITITPAEKPKADETPKANPAPGGVVQASGGGVTPAAPQPTTAAKPAGPTFTVSMPKFNLVTEKKVAPGGMGITMVWERRVQHLPDPTKDGAMGPGLVGQMFLIRETSSGPVQADAEGRLTVALYNEVTDIGMPPKSVFLGQWVFEKDALKGLVAIDERWGKHHQVFLPWPTYNLDVTKIKLTAKFEPEGAYPLFAREAIITIDTSVPGSNSTMSSSSVPLNSIPPGVPPAGVMPPGAGTPPGVLPPPSVLPPTVSPPSGGLPPQVWQTPAGWR
jgi:hypothetical protein